MVKDPLACLLTAYLTRRFGLQTLVLFRHPAGFASSVDKLGWPRGQFLAQFLEDEALMASHLEPWRSLLHRYRSEDSLASAAVLHGALNVVLWRFVSQGAGQALLFEDFCLDPLTKMQELFRSLGIPYDSNTESQHRLITSGPSVHASEFRAHEVVRDSRAMAYAWAGKLTGAETSLIRGIWEQFDLPLYRNPAEWEGAVPVGSP
jgi:hypothetical protein